MLVVAGLPLVAVCYACRNAYVEKKRVKSGKDAEDELHHEGGIAAYFCPGHIDQVRVAMRSAFQPFRIVITYLLRTMYM